MWERTALLTGLLVAGFQAECAVAWSSSRRPAYIEQLQDHFDVSNQNRWRQAYYINDTFWTPGSDAPIFLCVGGEGPAIDGSAISSSVHCNNAVEWLPEKKALMFALEHRYYGCHNLSACPVSDLTRPDALAYLSSSQAVADIATFVRTLTAAHGLTTRNKWVTWGGSYPGMLAAWSRLKHPELIHASVASSAPVSATLDMPEYFDKMADAYSINSSGVGGSPACRDAIREGHAWIEDRFAQGATGEVEQRFGLAAGSLQTADQQIGFAASGVADFPAQENDPLCPEPACNIAKVCAIMTDSSAEDTVQRLIHLRAAQALSHIVDIRGVQESRELVPRRRPLRRFGARVGDPPNVPDYWYYQTCTEFGFYQTCEVGSNCMFVRGILDVSYMAANCAALYNVSLDAIKANINATNLHYGGLQPTGPDGKLGRCVMWPNGEVDPWSTRSVLQAPSQKMPTLLVAGASHHAWTWPSRAGDQESVTDARLQIRKQVEAFLDDTSCEGAGPPGPHSDGDDQTPYIIAGVLVVLAVAAGLGVLVRRRRLAARTPLLSTDGPSAERGLSLEPRTSA
ncbi:unnamed protein product [Polarella glacialis]|uniref:Uncharacterized protein n=2 Tax=Polarella glacialis TaxID=89957 RepID=A0A813FU03_POLGL|nr:unnamed protein product [Polarella glacialis]|eukprot:CAMPEP_0115077806 /NCGR_PEP_ID=MMETSP0227-20121206/17208_1 /TAXON_ID=89957 /ORGANISM="Polarella glacialis, Strain CCMP 1383" /LENGTH=568 /DNA_ID=CAMNT_0002465141 /DNA_START=75 /DNA_END=1781 /DNA_ORIENTATION=+